MSLPKYLDREAFITRLTGRFPEVSAAFSEYGAGLLHCEMADFRRVVETAMDDGRHAQVERYLRFVDECLQNAGPELQNAIEVSFVEDFALGDYNAARHNAVRERMPARLRQSIIEVNPEWR